MKYLKLLVMIILVLLLLVFVVQNVGQEITLKFFSDAYSVSTEMIIVLILTIVVGFLFGYLIAGIQVLEHKNRLRLLNNEYKKLKKEIDLLRNRDLEEMTETE